MKGQQLKGARNLAYIALFAALMALCAWISVPFTIPFTMQTFAVLLAVGVLGTTRGLIAVALYLALGMVGLPVFSGFSGGIGKLVGPTGGYLIGFLFTALVTGGLIRLLGKRFWALCIAMAAGILVCYGFGTVWYVEGYARGTAGIGYAAAFMQCVVPFLLPDAAKIILAAWMTNRLSHIVRINNERERETTENTGRE